MHKETEIPFTGDCSSEESILILRAFILDTYIEQPEKALIVDGKDSWLLSQLFNLDPDLKRKMIEERANVFCQLGWEVPR